MATKIIEITAKNGVTYIYEDYSYWDKERGYSTHKRKCIGKVGKGGHYIYNEYYKSRQQMNELKEKLQSSPKVCKTTLVGQRMLLESIVKQTKIEKILSEVFGKEDAAKLLALAYYYICRSKALSRAETWLEDRGFDSLNLSSQRISELLSRLDDDKLNTFFCKWVTLQSKGKSLLFDITSISTYGKDNRYAERGYNRDKEKLEQINLSLLMSCENSLPLWYAINPGSMSDKIVVDYVLKSLEKLGVANFTFVGDRGFYSSENLLNLVKRGHKFTLPVPSHIVWQKQMIGEHKDTLRRAENVLEDDQTIIYGKTVHKISEYGRTYYHIYFDPTRKEKNIASFMLKLQRCKEELESDKIFEVNKKLYETYFIIKKSSKGQRVTYNDEAIDSFIQNDSCYWLLISTSSKSAAEALHQYRLRNEVEISFDDLKNMLDLRRLRNHNEKTVKGKVFCNFLALIILSQLRKTVNKIPKKERKYWSEHDMLDKVDSFAKIHFSGKYKDVYTTATAAQRTIFNLLGIEFQYKDKVYNDKNDKPNQT